MPPPYARRVRGSTRTAAGASLRAMKIGHPVPVAPEILRVTCGNPSPLTGPGTNSYVIGRPGEAAAVVDPGPGDARHENALRRAAGGRVAAVLVTHAHLDHSAGAAAFARSVDAPVLAFGAATAGRLPEMEALAGTVGGGEGLDADFRPDRALSDGEVVEIGGVRLEAIHTPGHFGGHLSFAIGDAVLSGDLVMGWATTLISPPDGDLGRFRESCGRLRDRAASRLLPGHGEPVTDPAARIDALLAHRAARDAQIVDALRSAPGTPTELAARIYDVAPALLPAAARNVLAHLLEQVREGRAVADGPPGPHATFHPP